MERLCLRGELHLAACEYGEALAFFLEAWELLPEPREEYQGTARVIRGLTRVMRARGDLAEGIGLLLANRACFTPAPAGARQGSVRRGG
ncbi:MAG: hypothetical protein IPO09_17780 [Anaeromyxobacter sp.]|nr:hypothetical protein [Anaeromyxobacter sp.]